MYLHSHMSTHFTNFMGAVISYIRPETYNRQVGIYENITGKCFCMWTDVYYLCMQLWLIFSLLVVATCLAPEFTKREKFHWLAAFILFDVCMVALCMYIRTRVTNWLQFVCHLHDELTKPVERFYVKM